MLALLLSSVVVAAQPSPRAHWVFFADKPTTALDDAPLSQRALARRAARRSVPGLIDERDRPVNESYLAALRSRGAEIRTTSRWLNAASVVATPRELAALRALPFVSHVQPVRAAAAEPLPQEAPGAEGGLACADYGLTAEQLAQMDLIDVHARGFTGAGMVIGVLDTGFNRVHAVFNHPDHPLEVIAEYDFINDDPNTGIEEGDPETQHRHGTWILGTMGGYAPVEYLGAAFDAAFVLAKTEDVSSETQIEEDYYVAGLEFIEANGADVATSSLGYFDWYTPEDFDGMTAVTTIAVNIATQNGLVCLTAVGNGGHDGDPLTHHLGAPADAFDVLSCGAVYSDGLIAEFSSDGPTVDGRVKPELLARGVATAVIKSSAATGYGEVSGTSLSTPLVAGAAACLLQGRPDFDVATLREALFATATDTVAGIAPDPLFIRGYGIVQAEAALLHGKSSADFNLDGVVDGADLGALLSVWAACPDCVSCPFDLNGDSVIDGGDYGILLANWG